MSTKRKSNAIKKQKKKRNNNKIKWRNEEMRQLRAETSVSTANITAKCRELLVLQVDKLLLPTRTQPHNGGFTFRTPHTAHSLACLGAYRQRRRNQRKNLVASSTGLPTNRGVCMWWMCCVRALMLHAKPPRLASPRPALQFAHLANCHSFALHNAMITAASAMTQAPIAKVNRHKPCLYSYVCCVCLFVCGNRSGGKVMLSKAIKRFVAERSAKSIFPFYILIYTSVYV